MTGPQMRQAIARLREILAEEPPEPEAAPKDKPYSREHHQWQRNLQEWRERIGQWQKAGLKAVAGPDGNAVHAELYGEAVPGTGFSVQPDGSIAFRPWTEDPGDPPPYGWTPPLELPQKGQSLEKFQKKNAKRNDHHARWGLASRAGNLLRERLAQEGDLSPAQLNTAASFGENAAQAEVRWIALSRGMLDPQALPRLKKWTGQEIKGSLPNYNLAVLAEGVLSELARTNPGALDWWMLRREAYHDLAERQRSRYDNPGEPPPSWTGIPKHPGEIISLAREEFRQAGGTQWKAFAAQPAEHTAEILKKEGPESAAWIANALAKADLPERKPGTKPAKKPKKDGGLQDLFQETGEPEPGAPEPAGKLREQPPVYIKLLMARLAKRTMAPGHELDIRRKRLVGLPPKMPAWPDRDPERIAAAMTGMAALAFREYAGHKPAASSEKGVKELQPDFNCLADYVFVEPEAAARAATWRGLRKAAEDWHSDASLRLQCQQLAEAIAKVNGYSDEWDAPLKEWTSPSGFTARLLKSAAELLREAELLQHCAGSIEYASYCHAGTSRIFRLEPAGLSQEGAGYEERSRAEVTTVDLAQDESRRWHIYQHTGYRNRRPTPQEQRWAQELLDRWTQAEADELLKDLRTEAAPAPPIMEAWQHTVALLPADAAEAMDRFYRENGIDSEKEHAFACQAAKHSLVIKWINRGAWTADEDEWLEDVANDLCANYEALILRRREGNDGREIDRTVAAAAFRTAGAVFRALNAAGTPPKEKADQARQAFQAVVERAAADAPVKTEAEIADTRAWLIRKYIEEMDSPEALPDRWALCMHNQGTPDAYNHLVPNPMPPDDRPAAWAVFQMNGRTTDWRSDDGGTINYCPCRTCRADLLRKAERG